MPIPFYRCSQKADYIIDLHTGAIHRTNLPQIRACLDNHETLLMAKAFGTPVIIDAALRDGSLRAEAEKFGTPVLTYEAGEALRFEPIAINAGILGVQRVMQALGMQRMSRKKYLIRLLRNQPIGYVRKVMVFYVPW